MVGKTAFFLSIVWLEGGNRFTFAAEKGYKAKQIH